MIKNILVLSLLLLTAFIPFNILAQLTPTEKEERVYKDFKVEFMWDAKVEIGNMVIVADSKHGTRRMIPIKGGSFKGPNIQGEVLPGGEDWQVVRPDGDTELNARYLLKTNDSIIIQVINKALMHVPAKGEEGGFYVKSVVDLEAPNDSQYAYLNHAIFLGTLTMPQLNPGEKPYVIIGVYKLL
ncbi:DUF3237 domain-containing protein [Labilibaculum sp. K2S]|uniref:DUF3237 domain-containing protein n=1 Tax=Labilibaculum sp. K2S TaxID=3056386 RepID=UPI0025A3F0F7|nr:DUF3237 domain-containing protein [Labilibaculum sp. K2S]MDM8161534.1 DUF3237 domain-containing protein [Labilibaculum sp. K2S]